MPIVSGITSTLMIRLHEANSPHLLSSVAQHYGRTPIFAVSAALMPSDTQRLIDNGFDGWVPKPVDFARLNKILLGAYSVEARRDTLYDKEYFVAGGWFKDELNIDRSI
jgi:CheY-like chemotaxis protein